MDKMLFALSLGFAGLILATHAGWAAPQCAARDGVIATLAQKYGETRRGIGMAGDAQMMEIFANTDTGSWTITVTVPNGTMCLVATGQSFETLTEALPAPGDPA